jgi:hypothetical protein
MKPLNETESTRLLSLLKRAMHNGQLSLCAAIPYADDSWKKEGWEFNDTHSGNSVSNNFNVDLAFMAGDIPNPNWDEVDKSEELVEVENYPVISIYVDKHSLNMLTGNI